MTPETREAVIKGEELFEVGRYQEALAVFESVLESDPHNDGALNDAGLACAEVGREAEAILYFEQALAANPENSKAFYNLLDFLIRSGDVEEAADTFMIWGENIDEGPEKARYRAALKPLTASRAGDFVNDDRDKEVADLGFDSERKFDDAEADKAAGTLAASNTRDGVQSEYAGASPKLLAPTLNAFPSADHRTKVAFVCFRNDHFLRDIERLTADRHEVQTVHFDYGRIDLDAVQRLMDWADVTWFEWFDGLLVEASRRLRKSSKVICRLHRFEAFTEWPAQVDWGFIDRLVLVSPHMLDVMKTRQPDLHLLVDLHVIYNGVDLTRFHFTPRRHGYSVAVVADLRSRKNPSLILQCIDALRKIDDRYALHLAGEIREPEVRLYLDHMLDQMDLRSNVHIHGWIEDMDAWLEDKNYLLSTSIHESFGYGIAEAMARGIKPIIHHFPGADRLFPRRFLFATIREFIDRVRNDRYDSRSYRDFIEAHYSLAEQADRIDAVLKRWPQQVKVAV